MQLTPYLIFDGNCEEALNFYSKALGGEIKDLMRYENAPAGTANADKQKVMHTHFAVDGNVLFMASDSGMEGQAGGPGGMVHLSLNFTDPGRIQNAFNAMGEGGKVTMPLQDTFWGATFGMLTDRYGINWMFNYDKPRS